MSHTSRKPRQKPYDSEGPVPQPIESEYRSAIARAILSAAGALSAQLKGAVGRRTLVNFLRGNQVFSFQPPCPAGFGLLENHTARWIQETMDRLVEEGYLAIEPGIAAVVSLTPQGRKAVEGSVRFPPGILPAGPRLGSNPELEGRLQSLRRELARAEGRAAYGIFPNTSLAELAARRPKNLAALSEIRGLGEARIRKYGRKILAALR